MKTTLLQQNATSLSFKLISILFILALNASTLGAQTSVKKAINSPVLMPTLHYQKKTTTAVTPLSEIYSVIAAKAFPIIESADKPVLIAMDDTDNFNYEDLFCSKTSLPAKESTDSSALALNYQIQKETISSY